MIGYGKGPNTGQKDLTNNPHLLYADDSGSIMEHPSLLALGNDGGEPVLLGDAETMEIPQGSDLFMLPGRTPIGFDPETNEVIHLPTDDDGLPVHAVAVFLAPAHTTTLIAEFATREDAPDLPLFSYAAVGFCHDSYQVAGARVDKSNRQDPWLFDLERITVCVTDELAACPDNRLLQQLKRCALEYQCRAAQNYFLHRHEAPLPTSIACNARCLGCISLQPDGTFKAAHDRLSVAPSAEDVSQVALTHIGRVTRPVVSFGQGCEGEPLLMSDLLIDSVRKIRAATNEGTINLNTNGSLTKVVTDLCTAGLDSMRISLNSARPDLYNLYYNPRGYSFDDVIKSMRVLTEMDRFVSLNLLYFPGVTDRTEEIEALVDLIEVTGLEMIQLRNMNIDPDLYRELCPPGVVGPGCGLREFKRALREKSPNLRFGYFNPPREAYISWRKNPL